MIRKKSRQRAIPIAALPSDQAEIRSLAIPFIVVEGGFLSLYVTRLNENGVPFVSLVNLHEDIYQSDRLNCLSSPSDARLRSFVALAVLLDEFLGIMQNCDLEAYQQRRTIEDGSNIFSTTRGSHKSAGPTKRSRPSSETETSNATQGTDKEMEREACEAASCRGRFKNVVYPFTRFLIFGDDGVVEYQSKSPYYFKGEYDREQIIDVSCPDLVEKEWMLQWRAHSYNVPVASPVSKELIKSQPQQAGHEYLVAAMEFVDFDEIDTIDDDVISFSVALLSTVKRLHSKAAILHCDLKPNNVRWSKGVVKLIDFGRAQLLADARMFQGQGDTKHQRSNGRGTSHCF